MQGNLTSPLSRVLKELFKLNLFCPIYYFFCFFFKLWGGSTCCAQGILLAHGLEHHGVQEIKAGAPTCSARIQTFEYSLVPQFLWSCCLYSYFFFFPFWTAPCDRAQGLFLALCSGVHMQCQGWKQG